MLEAVDRLSRWSAAGLAVIAGLGLIGVPGTAGFVSKWYLIAGALERDMWWLAGVIVVSSLLAVLYIGRVVEVAWFHEPGASTETIKAVPPEMAAITWVLAAATIWFGFDTTITAGVAGRAAEILLAGYS